jgi:hypothetical protein
VSFSARAAKARSSPVFVVIFTFVTLSIALAVCKVMR